MNVEQFRDYCISKPGVTEGFPFGEPALVFKVMNKVFVIVDIDAFDFVNLKCDPDLAIELRETYSCVKPGYHMNKKHWNSVYFDGTVADEQIFEWVDLSYNLVASSLTKRDKEALKNL